MPTPIGKFCKQSSPAPDGLTRSEIQRAWPDASAPPAITLWRWLERAVFRGTIDRTGRGFHGDPFRYRMTACAKS